MLNERNQQSTLKRKRNYGFIPVNRCNLLRGRFPPYQDGWAQDGGFNKAHVMPLPADKSCMSQLYKIGINVAHHSFSAALPCLALRLFLPFLHCLLPSSLCRLLFISFVFLQIRFCTYTSVLKWFPYVFVLPKFKISTFCFSVINGFLTLLAKICYTYSGVLIARPKARNRVYYKNGYLEVQFRGSLLYWLCIVRVKHCYLIIVWRISVPTFVTNT